MVTYPASIGKLGLQMRHKNNRELNDYIFVYYYIKYIYIYILHITLRPGGKINIHLNFQLSLSTQTTMSQSTTKDGRFLFWSFLWVLISELETQPAPFRARLRRWKCVAGAKRRDMSCFTETNPLLLGLLCYRLTDLYMFIDTWYMYTTLYNTVYIYILY